MTDIGDLGDLGTYKVMSIKISGDYTRKFDDPASKRLEYWEWL